jgi:hypothetical protein
MEQTESAKLDNKIDMADLGCESAFQRDATRHRGPNVPRSPALLKPRG